MVRRTNYLLQRRTFYAVQKGTLSEPLFVDEACYHYYLNRLLNSLRAFRLQLHTYVLLPREVRFLISPYSGSGLVLLMESVATDYGEYFYNRFNRISPLTGSNPVLQRVGKGDQVLNCQKAIELAPVREQLVNMPGEYPWSGYRINAFGGHSNPVIMHHQYRAYCYKSNHPFQRYRDFVAATSSAGSAPPGL